MAPAIQEALVVPEVLVAQAASAQSEQEAAATLAPAVFEPQAVSLHSHLHPEEHLRSDPVVCQLLHRLDEPGHASNAV